MNRLNRNFVLEITSHNIVTYCNENEFSNEIFLNDLNI